MARSLRFLIEVLLLKITGAKIVWTIHNLSNHEGRFVGLEQKFSKLFAKLVDTPVVHSQEAARLAAQKFQISPGKIQVTPHPGYCEYYPNKVLPLEARKRFGYGEAERVFLFFGRIQPYKGIYELLEAFAGLPENCRLLIAGAPADEKTSERLTTVSNRDSRVQLHLGRVGLDDVQLFFHASDCAVFPFRKILSSGSIMLAMSFGKPLIAPDLPVIREIVNKDDVWLFDTKNPYSLRAALLQATRTWSSQKGKGNLEVAKSLTWEKMAQMILRIYVKS